MKVDSGIGIEILLSNDVIGDAMVLSTNRPEVGSNPEVNSGIVSVTVSVDNGWTVLLNNVVAAV